MVKIYLRKIYDKVDAFNFEIISVPFLDRDIPLFAYYGLLYISRSLFVLRGYVLMYFIVYKQRDWIQVIIKLANSLPETCTNTIIVQQID